MARKRKAPQPDADGYLRTGIYERYVGERQTPTPDESMLWLESPNAPLKDDLDGIREYLRGIILPLVEGPLTEVKIGEADARQYYKFDFGEGEAMYCDRPNLGSQEQWKIERFRDAAEAMAEMHLLRLLLVRNGQQNFLVRTAVRLGQLCERIGVRPFEHAAGIGLAKVKKARDSARRTNEKRAARRPNYCREVKSLMDIGMKYTPACEHVADDFDVTPRTVRNNTPELRPGRRRK